MREVLSEERPLKWMIKMFRAVQDGICFRKFYHKVGPNTAYLCTLPVRLWKAKHTLVVGDMAIWPVLWQVFFQVRC